MSNEMYFAQKEGREYLDALHQKIANYYDYTQTSGLHSVWRRSYIAYYGGDLTNESSIFDSAKLGRAGKQSEITKITINNYRNLIKYSLNIATANKTALNPVASNSDAKSQAQVVLASSLLKYYLTTKGIRSEVRKAAEYACLMGEGTLYIPWRPEKGEVYEVIDGNPIYDGDLDCTVHRPMDVIRDPSSKDLTVQWRIVRLYENKYDLAARHPELADKILAESSYDYEGEESFTFNLLEDTKESDLIPVFHFHHDKTDAVPAGRLTIFTKDVILFDGPAPYAESPFLQMVGDHLHGTPFGYSPFTDLLSLQQAINNLASILLSNNLTFGSQYIHTSDGELDVKKLDGGLRLLTSAEPPTPLQLTRSAPESFNFLNSLMGYQDTLSGINSTVKGNPPAQATSGAAMALLVSQALQYNSGLQESHNKTVESVGTKIVSHLQTFAKTPRLALIVGEANRPFLKQYSGLDIQGIKRVTVEESNPMSQTISGRLQIADSLMEKGLIKNANQYISILNGGTLDNATFSVQAAEINIKAENEALLDGEPVQALIIDDPIAHILSHRDVISSPEARRDPQVIANVLDHIHQHISLWRSADPALLQLLGFQPPPAPPAPAPQMQTPTAAGMPEDQPSGPNLPDLPDEAPEANQAMYQNQIKGE